jgi:hypothetical protein
MEDLRKQLAGEVRTLLIDELTPIVREEIRSQVYDEVKETVRCEISDTVRDEVTQDIREMVEEEERRKIRQDMDALRETLTRQLVTEITEQRQQYELQRSREEDQMPKPAESVAFLKRSVAKKEKKMVPATPAVKKSNQTNNNPRYVRTTITQEGLYGNRLQTR